MVGDKSLKKQPSAQHDYRLPMQVPVTRWSDNLNRGLYREWQFIFQQTPFPQVRHSGNQCGPVSS